MPNRALWEAHFNVGQPLIDAQHRALLAQCNVLADHCEAGTGEAGERGFDAAFEQLKVLAREHFEAELALLSRHGDAGLDEHREACEEFTYLAEEIATTDHFNRLELQRFLALWWLGHITGTVKRQRALFAGGATLA